MQLGESRKLHLRYLVAVCHKKTPQSLWQSISVAQLSVSGIFSIFGVHLNKPSNLQGGGHPNATLVSAFQTPLGVGLILKSGPLTIQRGNPNTNVGPDQEFWLVQKYEGSLITCFEGWEIFRRWRITRCTVELLKISKQGKFLLMLYWHNWRCSIRSKASISRFPRNTKAR